MVRKSGDRSAQGGETALWLVNGTDLNAWADRIEARSTFPVIIRHLVISSGVVITDPDFRSDEGVGLEGWDGVVTVSGHHPWVPDGMSVWEFGTDKRIAKKANDDYAKRRANPRGLNPAEITYVFVSPRWWSGKDTWREGKKAEGFWKDVRAYDAGTLATWLETTPAVHARVTRMLGRDPGGATDIDSAWRSVANATSPAMPASLVLSGRDKDADTFLAWLHRDSPAVSVKADSQEEALAFVLACLQQLPASERAAQAARALVVRNASAWDDLLLRRAEDTGPRLLLIPVFPNPDTAQAVRVGHRVIVPLDRHALDRGSAIELARLRKKPAIEALAQERIAKDKAERMAALASRSFLMMQRQFSANQTVERPDWAQRERAHELIPCIFAGVWSSESTGDIEVLEALTARPYGELEHTLRYWQSLEDPPVRQIDELWYVASLDDAWQLVAPFVGQSQLDRYRDVAMQVLSALDPAQELEPSQRWLKNIYGKTLPWSAHLRRGLADGLTLIADRTGNGSLGDGTGAQFVDQCVRAILAKANKDETGRLWASFGAILPTLAEASPRQFLSVVGAALAMGRFDALLAPVPSSVPFDGQGGTELLWSLEVLAHAPAHLGMAALLLAQLLERYEWQENGSNPLRSLQSVFKLWLPYTRATREERFDVIDGLRRAVPDSAWKLMLSLIPRYHDLAIPTYEPRWRDAWRNEERSGYSPLELQLQVQELATRLLADVGTDGERWAELIGLVDDLAALGAEAVSDRLAGIDPEALPASQRNRLCEALRTLVHRHRGFPDAQWSMPDALVERFEAELRRFESRDAVGSILWLFRNGARLPVPHTGDFEGEQRALDHERERAVRKCYDDAGLAGVWQVAAQSEAPWFVGWALAGSSDEFDDLMVAELGRADANKCVAAAAYLTRRASLAGATWVDRCLNALRDAPAEHVAYFLRCLPASSDTLDRAERLGGEVERIYWKTVPDVLLFQCADRMRAIRGLVAHGRAAAALWLIEHQVRSDDGRSGLDVELILQALREARPGETHNEREMFVYYVGNLLDYLTSTEAVDPVALARLEFAFLPLFEHRGRQPRVLHDALVGSPEFFVEVIGTALGPHAGGEEDRPAEAYGRRVLADQLLLSWRTPPPVMGEAEITLGEWVRRARALLGERGQLEAGDAYIGRLLHYTPSDPDGTWPPTEVCALIEDARSEQLEDGIVMAFYPRFTSRGPLDGGEQERELMGRYRAWADRVGGRWPRTQDLLQRIADRFETDAAREDKQAREIEEFER